MGRLTDGSTRLAWRPVWIRAARQETLRARTLMLDVPEWPGHRSGQHVDIRLTAEDGYQAQRSYSIASASESAGLELTIERMEDGEVPPYLVDDARPGDQFELRGPIGGYFVWDARQQRPLVLIAGGSGLVLRASGVAVQLTLTREAAPPADRPDASTRRINREMLEAPETR